MDILTDVFNHLRLQGTVYFQADFRAPWGMDIKGGKFANFHLLVDGECWLQWPGSRQPMALRQGDLVVFPHGARHALMHAPDGVAAPAEALLSECRRHDDERPVYGGSGDATTLICGHFEYDRSGGHPLLSALPAMIHLRGDSASQSDLTTTISRLTVLESASDQQGANAVVDRLAEILLIQVVRAYTEELQPERGFLAGLADPAVASVLTLIHRQPEHGWTVQELAKTVGASRSVLAERFRETVGSGPIQYLTHWRMQRARDLLTSSQCSVAHAAERVGYQSEWSFAKAFKRTFGVGPGSLRRQARQPSSI